MSTSGDSKRRGGNPPEQRRFKPGQSGNPTGRPKGSKNVKTVLEQQFGKVVTITENGRKSRCTVLELLLRRITHDGIKGNERSARLALRTAREFGVGVNEVAEEASPPGPRDDGALPDTAALRRIARRLDDHIKGETEEGEPNES